VNGQAVLLLRAFRFALATLESKLCRNVWQNGKFGIVSSLSQNIAAILSQWAARQMCIFMQKQMCIFVQAGYLEDFIIVMLKLMKLLPQVSQIMQADLYITETKS